MLRELALGVLRDLHDEHVAGGSPHDLSWNGAEFMTLRRAESAVPDHNKTPVIWAGGVQEDFRWVTGLHSSGNIAHAIGCQVLNGALQCTSEQPPCRKSLVERQLEPHLWVAVQGCTRRPP